MIPHDATPASPGEVGDDTPGTNRGRPVRVLVVEDTPDDAELMILALRQGGLDVTWDRVETAAALAAALAAGPWDAVLSDYTLPEFGAVPALEIVRAADPDMPFIVVSGTVGEEVAAAAMRAGANDYVLKHNLTRLAPALEREVREAERRRARRPVERAAAHLAAIVESSDDAIISKTLDGVLTSWNPAAERLYGWPAAEAVGRHISFLIPPDKAGELADIMARLRAGGPVKYFETVRLHRDGRRIDVSLTVSPIQEARGRLAGVSKTARDITDKKRAEAVLRASEDLYRTLLNSIPEPLFVYDRETLGYLTVNDAAVAAYGYTREEFSRMTVKDIRPPEDVPALVAMLGQATLALENRGVWRHRTKNGAVIEVEIIAHALELGGRPACIILAHNVTDRRRVEAEAARATALLQAVTAGTPDVVFVKDRAGKYLLLNPAAARLVGRPAEDLLGLDDTALFGPADASRVMAQDRQLMDAGGTETVEEEELTFGEVTRTFLSSKTPYRDAAGHVIGVIGIARDITERKRAAAAMRSNEDRVRLLLDSAVEGIYGIDLDGRCTFCNAACARLLGYADPGRLIGEDMHALIHHTRADGTPYPVEQCRIYLAFRQDLGTHADDEVLWRADGSSFPAEYWSNPVRSDGRIVGAVVSFLDVTERTRAQAALLLRDRAIHAATQGLLITDPNQPDNPVIFASPGFERLTGYTAAEAIGRNCRFLRGKDTDPAAVARLRDAILAGEACTVELLNYRKDGTSFWNELSISPIRDVAGRLTHFVGVEADVTARRSLEEQFRQAQKMEAVGQLAGGVAHDFNNLLTIINGYSDLILLSLPAGDPSHDLVTEIRKAGERSAGLTRQLLAFSRQQVLAPRVLDLNAVVADTDKMLRRLIGEDLRLATDLAPGLWAVRADAGQIEQVLMNLAVNARDAMPDGGRLTVTTRNVELDEAYTRTHIDARPGPHVAVSVADTGTGMPPDVMAKIFEPFYTTKGAGKGTGLGLATVYGIVKQSGGHVAVDSAVGAGTTFTVYLPQAEPSADKPKSRSRTLAPPRGTETILLVEDDDGVRALTRHVLAGCGYTMLEAADGAAGVRVAAGHAGPIHLLITDVVMPGVGGRVVAERVTAGRPDIRVLFVSGYTDDAVLRHGVLRDGVNFLQKPFSPAALADKVREVLDAPPA